MSRNVFMSGRQIGNRTHGGPRRSDRYQWQFYELLILDVPVVSHWDGHLGTLGDQYVSEPQLSEHAKELLDELAKHYWRLVDCHLTASQRACVRLHSLGITQSDVAKMLGCNQSSVVKSLWGNVDYRSGSAQIYGGVRKKLKRLAAADIAIQQLIRELRDE